MDIQKVVDIDGKSWLTILREILTWLNDPLHLAVTAIVLIAIYGGGWKFRKGRR